MFEFWKYMFFVFSLYARQKKDTDAQNRLLDSVGEGEGGMIRENSIKTCILSCVKQMTSPGWMHESTCFKIDKSDELSYVKVTKLT